MNVKEIKDLIEFISDKGFAEFEIERQGFRLRISRFKEPPRQVIQPATAPVIISTGIPTAPDVLTSAPQRTLVETETTGSDETSSKKIAPPTEPETDLHIIKSPIVGTFYRASSPTSDPFVSIGDHIDSDTVVCIIEAMKLMNEIQAEVGGEIARIYVESGQPVEYGQALFGVRTG